MSSFFGRLSKAFRLGRSRFLVGKDLEKNRYYEYPNVDGDPDPRRTKRLIQYHVHKELGEHDQAGLPTQWLMWLRHTRRSAPTIEELIQDKERIETTRHNALVLEQRDAERRLQLEQRALEDAQKLQQQQEQLEPSVSQIAGSDAHKSPRMTSVPVSTVNDEGVEQQGQQERRSVDMEVWEASRRRVQEKNAQQVDAFTKRTNRRAELNEKDAERERARRAMNRSPLEAFDVTFEDDEATQKQEQLKPRFGRAIGPGEQWSPQEWSPSPTSRRR